MVESYQSFVHGGEVMDGHTISRIYDQDNELLYKAEQDTTNVFSPQVAWNMTEILEHVVEQRTGQAGNFDKALAGKTRSTAHPFVSGKYKDAWCVGLRPKYVTALWMGYDKSDADHYLTAGCKYLTMLTKKILRELNKMESLANTFSKPENVETVQSQ